MSKTRLYQMYDLTAQAAAGPIILERRDGPAIRSFTAVLADKTTTPGQYPDQFELRLLGEQNDETSMIDPCIPQAIITGSAIVADMRQAPDEDMPILRSDDSSVRGSHLTSMGRG